MPRDDLQDTYDDEIDFRELFSTLWLNKKFILILTGIFAVLSVILFSEPNKLIHIPSPIGSDIIKF